MASTNSGNAATVSRSAAILGAGLALLAGVFLGFTLRGMMDSPSTRGAAPTAQQQMPPQAQEQQAPAPALVERIKALEKQTQLEPANVAAWTELGNLYFDTDQPEKAIPAYEKSLTLEPGNPDVTTDLGVMYRHVGKFDKALECFNKAIAVNPGHVIASFNKSVVLEHDKNDRAGALAALKTLAAKNPQAVLPGNKPVAQAIQELSQ
ncbi:tetratricopeptide repeat protein [Desulfovibrio sp. TomC]|uniref:tetratricopeptide repeat protein n=1 Tax=Desulfovibrio sp. TomC TaxID=1562888 RepID=UPI00057370F6|nr:tetratricopeptide repeat protein [Desulfovibrio sp. TomC]KHK00415.1 Cytochrome c heme lyase subunit CcmH [Desulfovibrio sp. TomC]